jgi:hypothetical protein
MAIAFQEAGTVQVSTPTGPGVVDFNFPHGAVTDGYLVFDVFCVENTGNDWVEYMLDEVGNDYYQIGATWQGTGQTISTFGRAVGTQAAGTFICKAGTNGGGAGSVDIGIMCATLYSGVDQTTPRAGWITKIDAASTTVSLPVVAATGQIVSSRFGVKGKATCTSLGVGATMRWQKFDPAYAVMISDQPGAVSVTASYNYPTGVVQSLLGVLVLQPTGGTPTPPSTNGKNTYYSGMTNTYYSGTYKV